MMRYINFLKEMKIYIQAKPGAKEEKVEPLGEGHLKVSVKEPPVGGAANRAIARAIAHYFNISPSSVRLVSGFSSRQKVFEVV